MKVACDTSVLVPALLPWHEHHAVCRAAARRAHEVPAHVLIECFSVLTRLPAPHRVSPFDAGQLILGMPFNEVGLPAPEHAGLVRTLAANGIGGGAVYDALVGATARHHGLTLQTRDVRARSVYELVGVRLAMV
ncbi:MAG: Ribonuclease VapC40 [bacterium ADurb.BinA028]|nr:MAG: Ribonuclease VapC40 [bacterium ADurb.BinA028]HPZ51030.1 type II toxin-antitoxin system VapC family toxin [Propionibacteriaceae bacterium]